MEISCKKNFFIFAGVQTTLKNQPKNRDKSAVRTFVTPV